MLRAMLWLALLAWLGVGAALVHRIVDSRRTLLLSSQSPVEVGRGEWDDWNGDAYVTDEYVPEDDDEVIVSESLLKAAMKQSNSYNNTKALQSTFQNNGVHFNIHDEITDESVDSDVRTDDPPFILNENVITEFTYSPPASNIERWNEDPPYFDEKDVMSDAEYSTKVSATKKLPPSSDLNAKPDYNTDVNGNFRTGSNEVFPLKKYVNLFSLKDSDGNESNSLHKKLNRLTAIAMGILILQAVIILK